MFSFAAIRACDTARDTMRKAANSIKRCDDYETARATLSAALESSILTVCRAMNDAPSNIGMRSLEQTRENVYNEFFRISRDIENRFNGKGL